MPPVLIRLLSDAVSPARIPGVIVEFYNTSAVFQTSGTTDVNGEVQVTLPDGSYDLMFFKAGVSILPKQPQRIVVDTLLTNHFEVTGHIRIAPESTDPLKCTISGYFKGVGGGPVVQRLIFEPVNVLTVRSGNVVAPYSRIEYTSDESGYFEVELLRNTKYNAYFVFPQDLFQTQPGKLDVVTPNAPAVALDNFLFPLPIHLDFSANTLSIPVGLPDNTTITFELGCSDGNSRTVTSTPWANIVVSNTNDQVVEASLIAGTLCLRGIAPGTATISTTRVIPSNALIDPLPDYTSESVVVTVA
jgi:hypothetical protein